MKDLLVAALGPALVLFISEIFRYFHAKNERKERFFYELYPKRLGLYEEIIREIYPAGAFEKILAENHQNNNIEAVIGAAKEKAERLERLVYRNVLFGHSDITLLLSDLADLYKSINESLRAPDKHFGFPVHRLTLFDKKIMEFIREESGKYVVNKKLFKFFKEFETDLRKYEKKRNHRPGPEKHPYDRNSH
jgi:hypothetical protein